MNYLFQHFWIILLAVTVLNAFIMYRRSKVHARQDPSLLPGYKKMFQYFLILGSIPWLVMGIGNLSGLTTATHDYLNPTIENPMVVLFHLVVVSYWILGGYWIFVKDGAAFLERHPRFFINKPFSNSSNINERIIKGAWMAIVLVGIIGEIIHWWPKTEATNILTSNDGFQMVYDFGTRFPSLIPLAPLGFCLVGFGIAWFHRKFIDSTDKALAAKRQLGIGLGITMGSLAGLLFIVLTITTLTQYFSTKAIYIGQQYATVEGRVHNYHPMPSSGHDTERFDVDSVHFQYSDFDLSHYGYNNAASRGGVISEGLYVRIGYFAEGSTNVILKLEVRR